jgi:enoyl-CoA hydratase/carnithine racemase
MQSHNQLRNSMPDIAVKRDGDIATVLLDNPEKLNALTAAMWQKLARCMHELSADGALRCIVVRGAGTKAFAAGGDIAEFAEVRNNVEQGKVYHQEYVLGALKAIEHCRHPTVAMILGPCVGGGFEIACHCDLRISGQSGRFGVPINRLGFAIGYGELAGVLAIAGRAVAAELLLEGRVLNADEAYAKGLVTRLIADDQAEREAYATARRIADGAPLVARWHKQYIRRLAPLAAPLTEAELNANFDYFNTEDYRIGYDAFINKKKPKFIGR